MKYNVNFDISFRKHKFKGKLIALEGNEGSGKTTQAKNLVSELKNRKIKAIYTKEPTNGKIGKLIRSVLSGEVTIPPLSLQYLFCADRAVHQLEISKYLKRGYIVVTDRYFWSAVAYGIADLEGKVDYYMAAFSILSFYDHFTKPDYTFFLDVNLENAMKRISKSHKHKEIYDRRQAMEKVEVTYGKLIKKFPEEFIVINANRTQEEVLGELLTKILGNTTYATNTTNAHK